MFVFYLFHLVVVVVLCEVGQAGVDVGPKQGEVDLDRRDFQFHIFLVFCRNIFVHLFHLLREGHKAFHRVIEVVVADAHGRVVEQVAEFHHRTVLQLRVPGSALQSKSFKKKRQIWNLIEVSSIEENRFGILFPNLLLPLVNPGNSAKALGAVLNFIFLATFLKNWLPLIIFFVYC